MYLFKRQSDTYGDIGSVQRTHYTKQQEPKICAYVGNIKELCEGFANGKDAYAMIAAVSFNKSYEECLEFHPVTHEYQPEGKARRTESKSVLLGERKSYAPYFKFSH